MTRDRAMTERCEPPCIMVNLNDTVRVKLTDEARQHFAKIRAELNDRIPGPRKFSTVPTEDEHGWYKDQLWSLLNDFGPLIGLGRMSPFQGGIAVSVDTPGEVAALREALREAISYHEAEDVILSKQPQSGDIPWRRMKHQEQRDALRAALKAQGDGV